MQGWRGGAVGEGLCGGKACGGHRLAEGEGRRPGGEAADTGEARVFRRSRNGLRPVGGRVLAFGRGQRRGRGWGERGPGRCGMIDGGKNHGTVAEGRAEQCRKR